MVETRHCGIYIYIYIFDNLYSPPLPHLLPLDSSSCSLFYSPSSPLHCPPLSVFLKNSAPPSISPPTLPPLPLQLFWTLSIVPLPYDTPSYSPSLAPDSRLPFNLRNRCFALLPHLLLHLCSPSYSSKKCTTIYDCARLLLVTLIIVKNTFNYQIFIKKCNITKVQKFLGVKYRINKVRKGSQSQIPNILSSYRGGPILDIWWCYVMIVFCYGYDLHSIPQLILLLID